MGWGVDGVGPSRRRAAFGDGGERESSERVPRGALASPLVEALLLLFFADLDLCLAAAAAGFIPSYAGLKQLRALQGRAVETFPFFSTSAACPWLCGTTA